MAVPNSDISKYIDCSVSSDNSETDPFKCPFHPEAGCTLIRNAYNVVLDGNSGFKVNDYMQAVNKNIKKENMICNIDGLLLTDNDNNLVKIPVYTYKNTNSDNIRYNVLPVDNCADANDFRNTTYDDTFNAITEISYSQTGIEHDLKILNVSGDDNSSIIDTKIRDACYNQQSIQNASIPVTKAEKSMAEKMLKTASNLSSQYSNDVAYNITRGVLDKNIPLQSYQTTLNTTPASIIGALATAAIMINKINEDEGGDSSYPDDFYLKSDQKEGPFNYPNGRPIEYAEAMRSTTNEDLSPQ